jgi:hypothetical protein
MPGQSPITHLLDSVRIRSHISRHRACANYYAWHHELPYCQVEYSYLPREPVFWQPTWNKDGTIRHDITIHDRYRAIRSSIKAKYRTFRDPIRTKYRTLNWFIRTKYRDLKAARVYPQHQSPLFRLPAELREYIYFYLVESKAVFHIYLDLFRIISRRCPSPLDWCQCQLRTSRLSESEYLGIIGLLMSCRRL